jgi:asparagine synthase (glutamine-hydrolysing)
MQARMRSRGLDRTAVSIGPDAVLAVGRYVWELGGDFSGPVLTAQDADLRIAADATLYYREDLLRALRLAGVSPLSMAPSHLILAAYRAWGVKCTDRLEGDYAFVLWDQTERRAFAARDFGGKRTLFFAEIGETLIVASATAAIAAHPDCPLDFDLSVIGETAAGMWGVTPGTSYAAIKPIPAGSNLVRESSGRTHIEANWHPPILGSAVGPPFDEAVEELRDLLSAATAERLATVGPTSVWMSGGWDSTAVFASGERKLEEAGSGDHLQVVSLSYPVGDPGREDDWIRDVAGRWGAPIHWIDVDDIDLFADIRSRAARRDQPFGHVFELWNKALMCQSVEVGSKVALDGNGGDQLFGLTNRFMADLFWTGRWLSLHREWRAKRGRRFRDFFHNAVQPRLPASVLRAAGHLRGGRELSNLYIREPAPWIRPEFDRQYGLREKEVQFSEQLPRHSWSAAEAYWYFASPYFPRIFSRLSDVGSETGVELRSPLLDRRVVEFAAVRPREERNSGEESKRLLRAAMAGLLPDNVLATRPTKTGHPTAFLYRSAKRDYPGLLDDVLSNPLLGDLGIVDSIKLRTASEQFGRRPTVALALSLYQTIETELWLRGRASAVESDSEAAA